MCAMATVALIELDLGPMAGCMFSLRVSCLVLCVQMEAEAAVQKAEARARDREVAAESLAQQVSPQ